MTDSQPKVKEEVTDIDVECPSLTLERMESKSQETNVRLFTEKDRERNKLPSPAQTRRMSLTRNKTETGSSNATDTKSSVHELNSQPVSSKIGDLNPQVNAKPLDTDTTESNKKTTVSVQDSKPVQKPAPKGLRPTVKRLGKQTHPKSGPKHPVKVGLSSDNRDITVLCDSNVDEKSVLSHSVISRTNVSSSKLLSQCSKSKTGLTLKQGEALSSGSKLLQDLDQTTQPWTRSQSKFIDNSQLKVCKIYELWELGKTIV